MSVNAPNVLQNGLLTDYRDAFFDIRRGAEQKVGGHMDAGLSSDKRREIRAYFLPAAHMQYQPYGEPVNAADIDSRSFDVANFQYSRRIDWLRADREDDLTNSLNEAARGSGSSAALLPERGLADLMFDTTGLIPFVPNAADGGTPYLAGGDRYGTDGNLLSGSDLSSQAGVRTAIYAAHQRFREFDDPWGQPLLPDSTLEAPMAVCYSPANNLAFAEAFNLPLVENTSIGANAAAATSNILLAQLGGRTYILWEWARCPADTMVTSLTAAKKAFLMQTRTGIVESYGDNANSDDARTNAKEYVQWEQRLGFGCGEVFGTIKHTT